MHISMICIKSYGTYHSTYLKYIGNPFPCIKIFYIYISIFKIPWNIAIFFNNGESLTCLVLEMLTHLKKALKFWMRLSLFMIQKNSLKWVGINKNLSKPELQKNISFLSPSVSTTQLKWLTVAIFLKWQHCSAVWQYGR